MTRLVGLAMILWALVFVPTMALGKTPDCTNPESWPAGTTFTYLKNAGVVASDTLDFKKTTVTRLASEKIGKDLYRQVHLVRFFKLSGEVVQAIAVSNASSEECSMSSADVYLVSARLSD